MLQAFIHAMSGVAAAVKGGRNMRIHLFAAAIAITLGAELGLDKGEWCAIILCCATVISLECMNTAVEAAVDLASPEIHPVAKKAKDCAAGAVLVSAIGAAVVGCIIFASRLLSVIVAGSAGGGKCVDQMQRHVAVIGGPDGPTAIWMTSSWWDLVMPLRLAIVLGLVVLGILLAAVALVPRHALARRSPKDNGR